MNQDEAERVRHQLIEERAYEIYQARGSLHGFDDQDWEQAEREIEGRPDNDGLPEPDDEEATGEESQSF